MLQLWNDTEQNAHGVKLMAGDTLLCIVEDISLWSESFFGCFFFSFLFFCLRHLTFWMSICLTSADWSDNREFELVLELDAYFLSMQEIGANLRVSAKSSSFSVDFDMPGTWSTQTITKPIPCTLIVWFYVMCVCLLLTKGSIYVR